MSVPQKLLVVSIDAMQQDDLPFARSLPGFAEIIERAAQADIEGVFPSVTYPCHTSQITGLGPAKSGIHANLQFQPFAEKMEWFQSADLLKVESIFDVAKRAGRSTAAVSWPVTAFAENIDTLIPEIFSPQLFDGLEDQYRQTTNAHSFEKYALPNLHLIDPDPNKKYFAFVNAVSSLILRHERPDVMFVHLVELDKARHLAGTYGAHVEDTLRQVDETLQSYLQALRDNGDLENTNIVLVSDHGHVDATQSTTLNRIFLDEGLIRRSDDGKLESYDIMSLSTGYSAQLFLADDITPERRAEVESVLERIVATPEYRIEHFWTADETREKFGLDGDFEWVVAGEEGVMMGENWDSRPVALQGDPDGPVYIGMHGHLPHQGGQPIFIAAGPAFVPGATTGRRNMLDEAPTFAKAIDLELADAEGTAIDELLVDSSASSRN